MIVIFAGPTISHTEVQQHLQCIYMPPICHGDLIRLMASKPTAIGIVDGFFEGAPSVWHKEILYAMDQGVHVFGSSSMGALRATELHPFGMRGVGQIFQWYRDGVIEDDDEVAVLHGPAEAGYTVASEPMVNIRATLEQAINAKIIHRTQHEQLISEAKSTFYKKRSWRNLVGTNDDLWNWIAENKIDLKKLDAIQMLIQMAACKEQFSTPFQSEFQFEWTNVWDGAHRTYFQADPVKT